MRFVDNLPVDSGASDAMDSCRLAGLLAVFNHPAAPDMARYVLNGQGVRHPSEAPANNPKNFTRDQLIPLVAGLKAQGKLTVCAQLLEAAKARGWRAQNTEADVPGSVKRWSNGPDWLSPSHRMHLRLCAGGRSSLVGLLWLWTEFLFYGLFNPLGEPNQLICQAVVAGPTSVKLLKFFNPNLGRAITAYWSGWRSEFGVSKHLKTCLGV